ncbi:MULTISPECIES: fasciclin domain-containing protein [unclassified Arcicella]|uniref:fasciclin domain-containing protein n=1 Tax=unclassified Arcicella TaxID=2644986 RepID=UPI002864EED0|nr:MULTISPECIES: fasciclin domain-containing protein [unclassified Arcicella]MDR6561072.1 putative surface protein with fasciclin (FAS1) repeats [Arcicella sp. BE51]MDR6810956.1 putative surface protein with fasciclin (FAS1) repeats [Arcicella sp. BE140]MDR6822306.1 putative surface protein with fasciclin (FAS1) repeats [Arcicella sp. BE139]
MKKLIQSLTLPLLSLLIGLGIMSCTDVKIVETTTGDANLYSYLLKYPEKYSDFAKVIDKSGYNGFLDAYGAYTMFAPTNTAVKAYLTQIGKTTDQLTKEEAQAIVKIHVIRDTLTTNSFKDGKLPLVTMYGQYLLSGVTNGTEGSSYTLNRQANIVESNIKTGNGMLHILDAVLKPATKTIAQFVGDNPDYSIFTQALKETGYYDSLNVINENIDKRFMTLVAESNTVLAKAGFTDYTKLKARYSKTGNPKLKTDSLNIYVAYHILDGAKYLGDIITATSHITKVSTEPTVVSSKLEGQTVLLNDDIFNGIREVGVELSRTLSDNTATNGVVHSSLGDYNVKLRLPIRIDWDVCDFPEIKKLSAYYGKKTYAFPVGTVLKDITWANASFPPTYVYAGSENAAKRDYLQVPMGVPSRNLWLEMKTPIIPKGKYKVWMCYRRQRTSNSFTITCTGAIDGETLTRPFLFIDQVPSLSAGELESLGWKIFMSPGTDINAAARLLGTIDIKTTDRHTFRLQAINGTHSPNNIDMIQFIPINQNQLSPRHLPDGTLINE